MSRASSDSTSRSEISAWDVRSAPATAQTEAVEYGSMSRAEAHRVLVGQLFDQDVPVEEIARRVGISVDRVDQILDQLDDLPHEDERAPGIEPIDGAPAHLRSAALANQRPAVTAPREYPQAAQPKAKRARTPSDEIKCGTLPGYRRHTRKGEKHCEPCREAYNEDTRTRKAANRAAAKPATTPAVKPQPLSGVVPSKPPIAPKVEPRPRVQIRWLVPRGEEVKLGERIEYGIKSQAYGDIHPVSEKTAEISANVGSTIYCRTVTDWQQVSE